MKHLRTIAVAGILAGAVLPALAMDISGAGATFPYPIYAKWADAYKKETGVGLNYQSIGSGGGIKQIEARTVTFGATDAPLSGADLDKNGLVQFPMVMGGIVPVVNLAGNQGGRFGHRRADTGQYLPRQDQDLGRSGDQETQSQRQAAVAGDRCRPPFRRFRHHLQFRLLPVEGQPGLENEGRLQHVGRMAGRHRRQGQRRRFANNVTQTKGSIGYVEYAYAKQNKLTYTKMINKDGKTVSPTSDAFQAAAANADWNSVPGYGVILTNQPGATSWPMTAATFILVPKQPQDPAAATEALKFFAWAYAKGDKMAEELDYVPMPGKVAAEIEAMWAKEIKDTSGKPLHVTSK